MATVKIKDAATSFFFKKKTRMTNVQQAGGEEYGLHVDDAGDEMGEWSGSCCPWTTARAGGQEHGVRRRASSSLPPNGAALSSQMPEEKKQGTEEGDGCSPPMPSPLGGESGGTSLSHFHDSPRSAQSFLMLPSMWLWSHIEVAAGARKTATLGSLGPSGPTLAVRWQSCGYRGV